jgi:hypothetical protein
MATSSKPDDAPFPSWNFHHSPQFLGAWQISGTGHIVSDDLQMQFQIKKHFILRYDWNFF